MTTHVIAETSPAYSHAFGDILSLDELRERAPAVFAGRASALRVLTIIEGPIFTVFEADFPFRFPRTVRECIFRSIVNGVSSAT